MTRTIYTKELLQEAVAASVSIMGVLRFLGLKQAGGTHSHIKNRIQKFDIDTTHFTGQAHLAGSTSPLRKTGEQILISLPAGSARMKHTQLKRAMLEAGLLHICSICKGGPEWKETPLTLDVDHVDGNWLDNRIENLRFLCPNCHSQQAQTNRSWKYYS